jgi:hypothetical protein
MRQYPRRLAPVLLLVALVVRPDPLGAHHEAIFGPQSSLVLSADKFVSIQAFSRELETSGSKMRESTTLVSAGVRVSRRLPLTFTAVLPYSWIAKRGRAGTSGAEDAVVYSPGHGLLFFGIASLPVWQDFRDAATQDTFRVGRGVVYAW